MALLSCRGGASRPSVPPSNAPSAATRTERDEIDAVATELDRILAAEWEARGITPAQPVDDSRYLRRVYLDVVGRIPTLHEIESYRADRNADRRARAVDALLASPAYADHWTNYWEDVLLSNRAKARVVDRDEFRRFLHEQFGADAPWNQVVHALIGARGINRGSGEDVNGAVNWLLQYRDNPQDLAGKVATTFLGLRVQCAQCHDHKTEKWRQDDFRSFAACFANMKAVAVEGESDGRRKTFELVDGERTPRKVRKSSELSAIAGSRPVALDGTDLADAEDRRQAIAAWISAPENPWFAKAYVNRMWAYLVGRGFVEPIDDFRESNPPEAPMVLQRLADDFAAHKYDPKRLIRVIIATRAYQLSASPAETNPSWSHYRLKPLAPDVLIDSISVATDLDEVLARAPGGDAERAKAQIRKQFDLVFDVDEDAGPIEYAGTVAQALMLMNGRQVNDTMRVARRGALLKILAMPAGDERRIETLYLRTLARDPTRVELEAALSLVAVPPAERQGAYEDLLWALLNSSEFVFNH